MLSLIHHYQNHLLSHSSSVSETLILHLNTKPNMEKTTSDLVDFHVDDTLSDRKILIAVDFGTTFSGVAWAQTRRVCKVSAARFRDI